MFERFTDDARRVVVLAQEDARLLRHDSIGTEHLLLAMLHPDVGGIATEVLLAAGMTAARVRTEVVELVGQASAVPLGHIPFTSNAKKALELSLREALQIGDDEIRSEHILLGVIGQETGVGARVIVRLGADLTHLRHQLIARRGMSGDEPKRAVARGAMSARAFVSRPSGPLARPRPDPGCSLCGRSLDRVDRMLVAGGMMLCDRCAHAAVEQLDALPDDAPKRVRFRRLDASPPDEREAIAAIERAFDAVVGPMRLPFGDAYWAVEGGEELEAELRVMDRAVDLAPVVINDISIERVRFVDADDAEVSLGLWFAGSTAPMVQPLHAVRVDGSWKISRHSVEQLAAQARTVTGPD